MDVNGSTYLCVANNKCAYALAVNGKTICFIIEFSERYNLGRY